MSRFTLTSPILAAAAAFALVATGALAQSTGAGADPAASGAEGQDLRLDWLDAAARETFAPVLTAWIRGARDAALERGAAKIPNGIRSELTGYVVADVLDRVRWRVDDSVLSVQQGLFRMRYTHAMTLDYVVVFSDPDAVEDPELWAHELVHVRQYRDWGVDGFVARYLADSASVEREAALFRWEWARAAGRVPQPAP